MNELGHYESCAFYEESNYPKAIKQELNHRMGIIDNIYEYVKSNTDSNLYCHDKKQKIKGDEEVKYIIGEEGIYKIIFGYLSYEEILNSWMRNMHFLCTVNG